MARFLYHVARGYTESFNIYGERKSFEWQQLESEQPVLFSMALGANAEHVMNDYGRGGLVTEERIQIPDYAIVYRRKLGASPNKQCMMTAIPIYRSCKAVAMVVLILI